MSIPDQGGCLVASSQHGGGGNGDKLLALRGTHGQ